MIQRTFRNAAHRLRYKRHPGEGMSYANAAADAE
jgi:hypothetical protein